MMAEVKKRHIHPHVELCRECDGEGYRMIDTDPILMGKGEIVRRDCKTCAGTGRVIISKVIETTIQPYDAGLLNPEKNNKKNGA